YPKSPIADRPAAVARRPSSKNATPNPFALPALLLFWAETLGAFMTINAIIIISSFIRGAYGEVINWPSRLQIIVDAATLKTGSRRSLAKVLPDENSFGFCIMRRLF